MSMLSFIMEIVVYNLKSGDKVVLDNDDCNVYEIFYYSNIGNGYICKCGRAISGSLILRNANKQERESGRKHG